MRAQPPAENNTAAQRSRCPQCQEIKQKHYEAARRGDTHVAEAMATAMGRHQRAAHSQQREPVGTLEGWAACPWGRGAEAFADDVTLIEDGTARQLP
ncbi:hypothetical protein [Streptomyces syringium]|uniref:hypothetical protein n=1 Tax=Streptomyces syringium TaxID=76729 RepID=UPI003449FCD7